tara:strand:- start:465 stop:944 length:480 start_codon:yes stop_codon:yes gene_type:complete
MSDTEDKHQSTKTSGRVKWFNNNAGYGFITAQDGDKLGEDVFVHHSALITEEQQYKYLVLGEYVEFEWTQVESSDQHKWQANNVKGVNGGKLMCETHKDQRSNNEGGRNDNRSNKTAPHNRFRGGGPRTLKDSDGKEWMLIPKTKASKNNYQSQNYEER